MRHSAMRCKVQSSKFKVRALNLQLSTFNLLAHRSSFIVQTAIGHRLSAIGPARFES
jgi:hypothetical protein